jgi:sugar O-acyltransferase (sialic acid O-acetyltransferase NeuD family)
MKKGILIIGAGGHAKSCIDLIEESGNFNIKGIIGKTNEIGSSVLGYKVIGDDNQLGDFRSICDYALIAVGQIRYASKRIELYSLAQHFGFSMPKVVSNFAHVSRNSTISDGTIVMPGVRIGPGVTIGENCILNTNCIIEHDSSVGSHSHISTGATVNGSVSIAERSFVGSGAIIRENLYLGANSFIKMGEIVTANISNELGPA